MADNVNGLHSTNESVFGAGGIGNQYGYPSKADYFAYNKYELHIDMPATTGASNNDQGSAAAGPQTTNGTAKPGSKAQSSQLATQTLSAQV